jgi:hypothetical protein
MKFISLAAEVNHINRVFEFRFLCGIAGLGTFTHIRDFHAPIAFHFQTTFLYAFDDFKERAKSLLLAVVSSCSNTTCNYKHLHYTIRAFGRECCLFKFFALMLKSKLVEWAHKIVS